MSEKIIVTMCPKMSPKKHSYKKVSINVRKNHSYKKVSKNVQKNTYI